MDFRFIVFPFIYKQTHKTEKRKSTSILTFFVLWTTKHQKRENDNWLSFSLPLRGADYVAAHALRETNALTGPESAVGLFRRRRWSVSEKTTGLLATTRWPKSPKIL